MYACLTVPAYTVFYPKLLYTESKKAEKRNANSLAVKGDITRKQYVCPAL